MVKTAIEMAEETGFTIFEGIPAVAGMAEGLDFPETDTLPVEDSFGGSFVSEDFDLNLDEALSENGASGHHNDLDLVSPYSTGVFSDIGPNDFELDLSEAVGGASAHSAGVDNLDFDLSYMDTEEELDETSFETQPGVDIATEVDLQEGDVSGMSEDDFKDMSFGLMDSEEEDGVALAEEGDLGLDFNVDADADVDTDMALDDEPEIGLSRDDTDDYAESAVAEIATDDEDAIALDDEPEISLDDEDDAVAVDDEPEISLDDDEDAIALDEPEISLDDEDAIAVDEEPEFSLDDDEDAIALDDEPEISLDDEDAIAVDDEPEFSLDEDTGISFDENASIDIEEEPQEEVQAESGLDSGGGIEFDLEALEAEMSQTSHSDDYEEPEASGDSEDDGLFLDLDGLELEMDGEDEENKS